MREFEIQKHGVSIADGIEWEEDGHLTVRWLSHPGQHYEWASMQALIAQFRGNEAARRIVWKDRVDLDEELAHIDDWST